jgi:hypothetical protein
MERSLSVVGVADAARARGRTKQIDTAERSSEYLIIAIIKLDFT